MKKKIGDQDLLILFYQYGFSQNGKLRCGRGEEEILPVCRCHSSSASALQNVLREYCA